MQQAGELAKNTSILMNVSEFDDVNKATDTLISSLQAFKKEGQDVGTFSMEIIDKYNEVGNNYAISTSDLADSLTRSSAALVAANNSLEQSIAMTAAANTTIQDPESVGNALKTVSMRIRGVKTELEKAGEDTEGMVTNTAKLQEKIMALTNIDGKGGINILTESGDFKSTYDILLAISKVWKEMDDTSQAALLELVAGKTRGSVVAALFQNGDVLEKAYKSASEASGSAMQELDTYLDSIQGRIDLFNNSLQTMWMNFIDTGVAKGFVDIGTAVIKMVDSFGLLPSVVGIWTGFKTAIGAIKTEFKAIDDGAYKLNNIFKKTGETAKQSGDEVSGSIKKEVGAIDNKTRATNENTQAQHENNTSQVMGDAQQIVGIGQDATETAGKKVLTKATWAQVAAEKAWAAVKGIAKGFVWAAVSALATAAITKLTDAIRAASQRMGELTDSAVTSANQLNDARSDVENYKEEISELREKLDSNTLSEQEAYDARAQLIDIQNQLIDKFGKEAEGINVVTGAIEGQIDAITRLQQKASEEWYTENQEAYQNAIDMMEETHSNKDFVLAQEFGSIDSIIDQSTGQTTTTYNAFGHNGDINSEYNKGLKKIIEDAGGIIDETVSKWTSDGMNRYYKTWTASFEGKTVEELDAIYSEMQSFLGKFAHDNHIDLSHQIEEIQNIRNKYINEDYQSARELYDLGRQNEAYAYYTNEYGAILNAQEEFYQASTDEARLAALKDYNQSVADAFVKAGGVIGEDGIWNIDEDSTQAHMQDFFADMHNQFATQEFELQLKTNDSELKTNLENIVKSAGENGLSALDNNQIMDMIGRGLNNPTINYAYKYGGSKYANSAGYTDEQISALAELQDQADAAGISIEDLVNTLVSLGIIAGRPLDGVSDSIVAVSESYTALTSSVEKHISVSEILQETMANGTELTQEQGDAIKELIGSEEEYADAIDDSNGYIIKNAAILKKLVTQKKQEQKATIQAAKSNAQLQYKNTVQQLQQVIKAMALEVKATGIVSNATLNAINVFRSQLKTLKQTIQQYALLEIQLTDAANAYKEFEAAKERDAQLTYGDSMIEMLQTINEGFKTGQVGTEAFQFAVEALVPEEFWKGIDDVEQRMISIHDYIDKNPLFADWFTIDEGEISITLDNINNFIDDAFGAGLFTGDSSGDFFLTDAIKNAQDPLKAFADQLGDAFGTEVTEGSVLAMLSELEKYDASWGNILTDLTTTALDRKIIETTDALDNALAAQEEFIRSGGDLNSDEYKTLVDNVNAAETALNEATKAAELNAQKYNQIETAYAALSGKITLTKDAADSLFASLGFVDANGDVTVQVDDDGTIHITEEQLLQLKGIADGITSEPTVMDMQLRYDAIDTQIVELQKYIDESLNFEDSEIAVSLGVANEEEAKAKIAELTAEQETISLNYNITATTAEQSAGTIEKLTTWETNGLNINISGNTENLQSAVQEANALETNDKESKIILDSEEANAGVDSFNNKEVEDKEPKVIIQGVPVAISQIDSVYKELDKLQDVSVEVSINETTYQQTKKWNSATQSWEPAGVNGTAHAYGTANASGDWGTPKTEVALTGELGPEMIVRGNRWFTVGDHGAEFTQVKKGDIIFNHKQTEDLLSKGYVTSRGKMTGGAFASGTAYYKTFGGYVGDNDVFENGSDKWMDPYTNLSNAADSLSDAADSISDSADEFKEVFDWIEVRLEELDETLGLLSAQLENAVSYSAKNNIIDKIIGTNETKMKNLSAGIEEYAEYAAKLLAEVPSQYRDAAQDGAIAITQFAGEADEATLEAINNYREWAQKVADLKQQLEEVKTEIKDLAMQKFDNVYEAGDARATVEDSQTEKIQNQIDLLEEMGEIASSVYYGINGGNAANSTGMFENSYKKIEYLTEASKNMQMALNEAVEAGQIEKGSNEWYEMVDQMYQIDSEIAEATKELEEFQNAINDIYWDNFDQLISRLDYLKDETQSLIDLMDSDDLIVDPEKRKYDGGTIEYWTADDVDWTDEGIASLGLYAQQMEIAEYTAKQYAEAIDDLEKDYKDGLYSENEYIEKLNELKEAQYENIEAYYDAQDAIVELNKTRIDLIKDGIEKELDAYEELIEKQKEALDAEKDLHGFQKSVMDQQKDIADLERQLAALSGDNSASARAKRAKLEAEIAEKQSDLEETYYDRSVSNQQEALEKELENFKEEKDKEIEELDTYLDNVEQVIADSLMTVQANASTVYDTLNAKADEYNLNLSESILEPWKDGSLAVSDYQSTFDTAMSSTINQLELLKNKWQEVIDTMAEAAKVDLDNINKENDTYVAAEKKPEPASKPTPPAEEKPKEKEITVGGMIDAAGAKIYDYAGDTSGERQYFRNDPIYKVLQEKDGYLLVRHHKSKSGATGWFKKSDVKAYAKGTVSLKNSGIINIDELGEELVLRAQNGRLTYMEKGSGVIPADLTSNLMEWGKLDPTSMLEQNRPSMNVHPEIHNTEVNLSMTYGDIIHIEEFNGDNPEDVAKLVAKEFEKHTKNLNNALRKYAR